MFCMRQPLSLLLLVFLIVGGLSRLPTCINMLLGSWLSMRSQRLLECLTLLPVVQPVAFSALLSAIIFGLACPVAVAVRTALESQLIACGVVSVGFHLSATDLWLGRKPLDSSPPPSFGVGYGVSGSRPCHGQRPLHCMGYCPFAHYSCSGGAGGGSSGSGCFLESLADFAATVVVPRQQRTFLLTQQPFLAWHVVNVLVQGSDLCVMRR
jgi:hypothetical protein